MKRLQSVRPYLLTLVAGSFFFLVGLGVFTFAQAQGLSYFSDDPNACMNCHVMRDQFEAWNHSSHARVATCNDCHSPHDTMFNKLLAKGINGFNHSFAFTFNTYEEVITITGFNRDIVNDSCLYCHQDLTQVIAPHHDDAPNCISCHAGIGHPTRE